MTKLEDSYMLPLDTVLDFETISEIKEQGPHRINSSWKPASLSADSIMNLISSATVVCVSACQLFRGHYHHS
jgi:hypothetical protein